MILIINLIGQYYIFKSLLICMLLMAYNHFCQKERPYRESFYCNLDIACNLVMIFTIMVSSMIYQMYNDEVVVAGVSLILLVNAVLVFYIVVLILKTYFPLLNRFWIMASGALARQFPSIRLFRLNKRSRLRHNLRMLKRQILRVSRKRIREREQHENQNAKILSQQPEKPHPL